MKPTRPKMILFDYGETLLWEPSSDLLAGERALIGAADANPNRVTPEQALALAGEIYRNQNEARIFDLELHEWQGLRLVNDILGLSFSLTLAEQEQIFWDTAAPAVPTPGITDLLEKLQIVGIRTGVISNMRFSGPTLEKRIRDAFPGHPFEFILASSEYGVRKPSPLLFRAALGRAKLSPEEVWFCGDHPQADVEGAAGVGIFPVWYAPVPRGDSPKCRHLVIHHWDELTKFLF